MPQILSHPPVWLRLVALVVVLVGLIDQVVDADTVGAWLWATAMAVAAVLIAAGLIADWRR